MNCKPGDLAILTRCPWPENIGAIVEVLECNVELTAALGDHIWRVKTTGRNLRARDLHTGTLRLFDGGNLSARDSQLRPISGVPVGEDVRDEVTA
ncbi:hypothetical protein FSO04_24240 [Paraburkholderia madseniana]|uniref:Uncharacterized protein n=1 Tax=Paraburkholderia madseniana TaxID=2599607 RepID=A0A6N6WA40_9BURK|nr:hypothetical protein [Paraburkholderia madseniana]KAE8757333.1 hypothetical protein FSO04_24240 [Paraburkholderia madseniana]